MSQDQAWLRAHIQSFTTVEIIIDKEFGGLIPGCLIGFGHKAQSLKNNPREGRHCLFKHRHYV